MDAYLLTRPVVDFQSDAYSYRTIGIAVLPRCQMPDGRAAACLPDCCVAATASRRGEGDAARAKGQGASEREGQRAGEGDEPTKEMSKRV